MWAHAQTNERDKIYKWNVSITPSKTQGRLSKTRQKGHKSYKKGKKRREMLTDFQAWCGCWTHSSFDIHTIGLVISCHGVICVGPLLLKGWWEPFPGEMQYIRPLPPRKRACDKPKWWLHQSPTWWTNAFLLGLLTGIWGEITFRSRNASEAAASPKSRLLKQVMDDSSVPQAAGLIWRGSSPGQPLLNNCVLFL